MSDGTGQWPPVSGGTGADAAGSYVVRTAANAPANAQILSALATGIVRVTTATGVLSVATVNTDYLSPSTPALNTLADAATATASLVATYTHTTSGAAAANYGNEVLHAIQSSAGTTRNATSLRAAWRVAADAAEQASFRIGLMGGATPGAAVPAAGSEQHIFDAQFYSGLGYMSPQRGGGGLSNNPAIRLSNADDCGIYGGSNLFKITSNYTVMLSGSSSTMDWTSGYHWFANGSTTHPSLGGRSDQNTGVNWLTVGQLDLIIGGVIGGKLAAPADGDTSLQLRTNIAGVFALKQVSMEVSVAGHRALYVLG